MSQLVHRFRFLAFSIREIGILPTCRSWLLARLGRSKSEQDNFDPLYGTDTSGTLTPSEVQLTGSEADQASAYTPIESADFHRMIDDTGLPHEVLASYTFADMGSGKGRAVLLAASYPFKRAIGVEISAMLHAAAEQNATLFQKNTLTCAPIDLYCQDATTFTFPPDPLIIFFFHPFDETVMSRTLDNIRRTLQQTDRPILLLYNRGINLPPYPSALMEANGLFHCEVERAPNAWKGQTGWYVYAHHAERSTETSTGNR